MPPALTPQRSTAERKTWVNRATSSAKERQSDWTQKATKKPSSTNPRHRLPIILRQLPLPKTSSSLFQLGTGTASFLCQIHATGAMRHITRKQLRCLGHHSIQPLHPSARARLDLLEKKRRRAPQHLREKWSRIKKPRDRQKKSSRDPPAVITFYTGINRINLSSFNETF